jgi:hypothetical protein
MAREAEGQKDSQDVFIGTARLRRSLRCQLGTGHRFGGASAILLVITLSSTPEQVGFERSLVGLAEVFRCEMTLNPRGAFVQLAFNYR